MNASLSDTEKVPFFIPSWDGSNLGVYSEDSLIARYKCAQDLICEYYFPSLGVITGMPKNSNRKCRFFPTLIEKIKNVFQLPGRGHHYIKIGNKEKILYQVQRNANEIVYEVPLSLLPNTHKLHDDLQFRNLVQETIVVMDVLCLSTCNQSSIRVRRGNDGICYPVAYNESKEKISEGHDTFTSVISKSVFSKWFDEDRDENYYKTGLRLKEKISGNLLEKLNEIIREYAPNYLWYSSIINSRFYNLTEA